MEVRNINNVENTILKSAFANRIYNGSDNFCANKMNFKGLNFKKPVQESLKWVANNFSSPHQRAILGITALCSQPFIDLHNKHIKKEDKPITVSKTIAKIVVGTTIGIALRYYSIKAVKNFTNEINIGKYSQCLLPQKIIDKLKIDPKSIPDRYLLNYKNGLGTFIGVMGGLFTNFIIDAPLSKKATNLIYDNFFKKENADGH